MLSSRVHAHGLRQWTLMLLIIMIGLLLFMYHINVRHTLYTQSARTTAAAPVVQAFTRSELVFMGTGTSAGTPRPKCLLDPDSECSVCRDAITRGPTKSRNWRGNPSLLIRYRPDQKDSAVRNIQIDVGKTFYTSMLYIAPKLPLWPTTLHAVILTHSHADAVFGLDELRDFSPPPGSTKGIPVYATSVTKDSLKTTAPYLFPGGSRRDGGVARRVSQLDWRTMVPLQPFEAAGLPLIPIAMWHGGSFQAMGFVIGHQKRIVYISDVNEVPVESMDFLQTLNIEILILEAFSWTRRISSHINLEQALPLIRQLAPERTYITGISHDMDHERLKAHLATYADTESLIIQPAYDGLRLPCDL